MSMKMTYVLRVKIAKVPNLVPFSALPLTIFVMSRGSQDVLCIHRYWKAVVCSHSESNLQF